MESGVEVWLRLATTGAWVPATVQSKSSQADGKIHIEVLEIGKPKLANGDDDCVSFVVDDELTDMNDLKLKNSETEGYVENLIKLPYLHEPAILHCLEQRYFKSDIYTYTGPILIAVNPFKKVDIYTSKTLEVYYNHGLMKSQNMENSTVLPPHVFAIADAAYREMMKVIMNNYGANSSVSANQAILISGESGAGKTESTKVVLKYLTTVGNPNAGAGLLSSAGGAEATTGTVMDKILQSNPILEAFGNARTLRNDNSSRFGKYIDLNFNKRGHLIGGTIRTYLLEKVRLPTQQAGERNFHIFYQLFKGGSPEELADWALTALPDFFYTNQGGIYDLKHIDDAVEFQHMKAALQTLNFDPSDQKSLLQILAGLVHIGQLQFEPDASGEGCQLKSGGDFMFHAETAARLCGLDVSQFVKILTIRNIVTRNESYEKKLTPTQAIDARDAFAKSIYGKIFDWIVVMINRSIIVDQKQIRADIGVLDIFGFECFQHNSFEQLCINYTNEALQQQFNQYVFKMEQQEYQNEKIKWNFIEFPDNQDCLQLIDHKRDGILAMIDDETKAPGCSDQKLAGRMYKSLPSQFARFSANAKEQRDFKFCIRHYAGPVVYSVITFVDKNKDELPKEASAMLYTSSTPLLVKLFNPSEASNAPVSAGKTSTPSVGNQFKEQLSKLMEKVYSTTPHYIRCLKPNDLNVPDTFNRLRTQEQLRYGGVLEAVRVARSGFPVRLSHAEFFNRYRSLANPFNEITSHLPIALGINAPEKQSHCEELLETLWDAYVPSYEELQGQSSDAATGPEFSTPKKKIGRRQSRLVEMNEWTSKFTAAKDSVQLGISKVFLRKIAHDVLEARRAKRLFAAAKKIQSISRGHRCRKMYSLTKFAIVVIQYNYRGYVARRETFKRRRNLAAIRIQTAFRRFVFFNMYKMFHFSVLRLQSLIRGRRDRKVADVMKLEKNTIRIQRFMRGLVALRNYIKTKKAFVSLQCQIRMYLAKKHLKNLKIAAKDLGKLKQSNEALKAEIEMLKAKAAEETKQKMLALNDKMEAEAEEAKKVEKSLRAEIQALKLELEKEKDISKKLSEENTVLKERERDSAPSPTSSKLSKNTSRGSISLSDFPRDSYADASKSTSSHRPSSSAVYNSPEYKELIERYFLEQGANEALLEKLEAAEHMLMQARNRQPEFVLESVIIAANDNDSNVNSSQTSTYANSSASIATTSEQSSERFMQSQSQKSANIYSNDPSFSSISSSIYTAPDGKDQEGDKDKERQPKNAEVSSPKTMKRNSIAIGGKAISPRPINSSSSGGEGSSSPRPGVEQLGAVNKQPVGDVRPIATSSSSTSAPSSSVLKLFTGVEDDTQQSNTNSSRNYDNSRPQLMKSKSNDIDLQFRLAEDFTPIATATPPLRKKSFGSGLVLDVMRQNVAAVASNVTKAMGVGESSSSSSKPPQRRPSSSTTVLSSVNPLLNPSSTLSSTPAVGSGKKSQLLIEKDNKRLRLAQVMLSGAGVSCRFWENSTNNTRKNVEVIIKLDSIKKMLQIDLKATTFKLFSKDIPNVPISANTRCFVGSEVVGDYDNNCFLTLVSQEGESQRKIAILVSTKEDRNILVDGLKVMCSSETGNSSLADVVNLAVQVNQSTSSTSSSTSSLSSSYSASSLYSTISNLTSSVASSSVEGSGTASNDEVVKLKQEITRLKKELQDRNEEISAFKKKESLYIQDIKSRDDIINQERDTGFRMGKKVESLYFDISEKMEEIEDLQARISVLQESLAATSAL